MSRCFPCALLSYVGDRILDEATVVVSTKREVKKAKMGRKREKIHEKKGRKAKDNGDVDNKKRLHKIRHRNDGSSPDQKDGDRRKKRKLDREHPEKSNLTEEYGKPINSHNSSDGTSNRNQMQMPVSASIFRIQLPLQWHRDPEVVPSLEQSFSAPVRTNSFSSEVYELVPVFGSVSGEPHRPSSVGTSQELAIEHGRTEQCLGANEISTSRTRNKLLPAPMSKRHRPSSSEVKYINLIERWDPPLYETSSTDLNDQQWLFEGTQKLRPPRAIGCKVEHDGLFSMGSTTWTFSRLLLKSGVDALPYTVPY